MSMCVCVCVSVRVCVCVCVCESVCVTHTDLLMRRPEVYARCLHPSLSPYFLRQSLLLNLEL